MTQFLCLFVTMFTFVTNHPMKGHHVRTMVMLYQMQQTIISSECSNTQHIRPIRYIWLFCCSYQIPVRHFSQSTEAHPVLAVYGAVLKEWRTLVLLVTAGLHREPGHRKVRQDRHISHHNITQQLKMSLQQFPYVGNNQRILLSMFHTKWLSKHQHHACIHPSCAI